MILLHSEIICLMYISNLGLDAHLIYLVYILEYYIKNIANFEETLFSQQNTIEPIFKHIKIPNNVELQLNLMSKIFDNNMKAVFSVTTTFEYWIDISIEPDQFLMITKLEYLFDFHCQAVQENKVNY